MRRSARAAGRVGHHVRDDDRRLLGERQPAGEQRRHGLHPDPDPAPAQPALVADVLHHRTHDVHGRGEADALVAAALAHDEGVDSDQAALDVHQRPAAAAGIDGRVGLQIDHGVVGAELARERREHAEADRVVEAQGAAEGEHDLALPQLVRLGEGQGDEAGSLDLEQGEVGLAVDAHHACGDRPAGRPDDRAARPLAPRRAHDLDAPGALHHVCVRDDVAEGVDHRSRAGRALRGEGHTRATGGGRAVARDQDLHHGRGDPGHQCLQLRVQLAETRGAAGGGRRGDGRSLGVPPLRAPG